MSQEPSTDHSVEAGPPTQSVPPSSIVIQGEHTLRRPASHSRLARLMVPGRSRSSSAASQPDLISYTDTGQTSGRSTPEQHRRNGKAASTSLLANDPRYKKYTVQVDKCLQSFESVNEWADFISFLSRLLKTLQIPTPPYTEIPRKLIVAKRLAQCLNPALPSGVHQRALDVYAYIFSIIGIDGLRRDLSIWSSGLFPFFQYATTSVRPILINLYESFYLPLGEALRPAVKAFILALLPGMEEESGDFFDKILALLSRVSDNFPTSFFLSNIYLTLISTPSARLSALNYLSRKHLKPPDTADTDGQVDAGLMIRGVAAVLHDENVLVRRNGLNLLLRMFQLDKGVLRRADEGDQRMLVRAAIGVVLQREMSLSRRVYTWLLGSDETSEGQIQHFKQYGLNILVSTLTTDMTTPIRQHDNADRLRPFKVFLSLLDKWEIGGLLSDRLALAAIHAVKTLVQSDGPKDEILMTASAVYEAIEPIVIWRSLYEGLIGCDSERSMTSRDLVLWLLTFLPQKDEEVASVHIPILLHSILGKVSTPDLDLITLLFDAIPDAAFKTASVGSGYPAREIDLPAALYSGQSTEIDDLRGIISGQIIPEIVARIFAISEDMLRTPSAAIGDIVGALDICSNIIGKEAKALQEVDGAAWMSSLLTQLDKVVSFSIVDAILKVALKCRHCTAFRSPPNIRSKLTMTTVLRVLFLYLGPGHASYHVRVVELVWEFHQLAHVHTLENVISGQPATLPRLPSLQAFGVLWRLTDDAILPGELFFTPIMAILDDLDSKDAEVKSSAETWMRCNVRSYFRVVDPILSRLLDPSVKVVDGLYDGAPDLSYLRYLIERLGTLFRFGGQGFSKACQVTEIAKSVHSTMVERSKMVVSTTSHMDLLVVVMTRYMSAEATRIRVQQDGKNTLGIQAASLDVLQHLLSRGDVSSSTLDSVKSAVITKLDTLIRTGSSALQSKMLHLLHSSISASSDLTRRTHRKTTSTGSSIEKDYPLTLEGNLVRTIIRAISSPSNRSILQHWVDFILMTAPQLQDATLLEEVCEAVSIQVRSMMIELRDVYTSTTATITSVSELEPIMLLNALDRLVSLLSTASTRHSGESGRAGPEGGGSIFGLVSGVFTAETPVTGTVQAIGARYLNQAVETLLVLWSVTTTVIPGGPAKTTGSQVFTRIQTRAGKMLDRLFKTSPELVTTRCVTVWAETSKDVTDSALFACIDAHTPSAQKVVEYMSKIASNKSIPNTPEISIDPAALACLEAYLQRLEAPIAVQVWSTMFAFAREILAVAASPSARNQVYPLLRCLTTLAKTVASTSALEDKRLRRDLQDVYAKVLDLAVTHAPKIAGSAMWERPSDTRHVDSDSPLNESLTREGPKRIYGYISTSILPNLRTFLFDTDRIAAACTIISTNIVIPALRKQEVDEMVMDVLKGLTKIPAATRAWRIQVGEVFNDPSFFKIGREQVRGWKSIISSLMDSDKERFGELLSRITAAPSANIFTNREQEMIVRSLNLRRLTFVLLAAERNHYLTQLPSIQEKLVDILRTNVVSPRVHSEVYLCLRVLLCRVGAQHLMNFWPVILTELLRVFDSTMDDPPPDGSESLQLILAACKFLDLLLVMQSEDFQIHQWMFITDTVDAGYPPEESDAEALMDRLSEILMEHSHSLHPAIDIPAEMEVDNGLRRPRLSAIRNLTSLRQLQPFFSRASIDTFEGVYEDAAVDWEAVEEGFNLEVFDA